MERERQSNAAHGLAACAVSSDCIAQYPSTEIGRGRQSWLQNQHNKAPEYRDYPKGIVDLVLKLRNRCKRQPGVTAERVVEELHKQHVHGLTEDDVAEIIDRALDAAEGEIAQIDSSAEWTRIERRRISRERMGGLEDAA
jgi:hypothetical protein